jgi:RNA polymerase sigma-54 factor
MGKPGLQLMQKRMKSRDAFPVQVQIVGQHESDQAIAKPQTAENRTIFHVENYNLAIHFCKTALHIYKLIVLIDIMQSVSLIQENQASLKQQQQLLVNLAMKQAFHVLQLPLVELSEWLKMEIEANPVLEIDHPEEQVQFREKSLSRQTSHHPESLLPAHISLYEHLTSQIPLTIEDPQQARLAELIIGHLNDKGFLETPLSEIEPSLPVETIKSALSAVQSFDPPGIAARGLQECLLLQLNIKGKAHSIAADIIENEFEDLLHNRLPRIAQKLQTPIPELVKIIETQIAPLDLYPGYRFCKPEAAPLIPDLSFVCLEGKWQIEINSSLLPRFQIAPVYRQALKDASFEEASYLRRHLVSGRWLFKVVQRRNDTLQRIGQAILKRQIDFFNGEKMGLAPMTVRETAEELSLHESTIARAISNKYAACPQGLLPLKSFFTQGVSVKNGRTISKHNLRKMLARAIQKEDKHHPLSDDEIARQFQNLGIACARRTVAKYRTALNIAPASRRKKY